MKNIKKILVACDLSKYAGEVVKYGAEVAKNLKAELILANVIDRRDMDSIREVSTEFAAPQVDKLVKAQKKEQVRKLKELVEAEWFPDVAFKTITRFGVPSLELVQIARDENVDLVVMGSKDHSNVSRIFFGSTTEKIFRRCPVPLLLIHVNGLDKVSLNAYKWIREPISDSYVEEALLRKAKEIFFYNF